MITIWSIFRDLINSRPIGILVTRYEIMSTIQGELSKFSKAINFSECTVDTMRNMSEKTGYETGQWLGPLCNVDKCGFVLSKTL